MAKLIIDNDEYDLPDGSPLAGGMVEFQSAAVDGKQHNARGVIGTDGTFRLGTFEADDGALAGEHRAIVRPEQPDFNIMTQGPPPKPAIDPQLGRYETSGLKFTVTEGENQIEIEVTRPPR